MKTITRTQVGRSFLYRAGLTAVDKVAAPATPTVADVATGGSLLFNTSYKAAVAAGTTYGPTLPSSVASVTTANDAANTHCINITIASVASSEYYDIFMSSAAAPFWVARVTEAQRAAGVTVTGVGVISAVSPGAGIVQVQLPGTGVATTAAPFTASNAFLVAPIPIIDCTGFTGATFHFYFSVTDFRSLPAFGYSIMKGPYNKPGFFNQVASALAAPVAAVRAPMYQIAVASCNGAQQLIVALETISGQGASMDIWVDLN